MSIQPNGWIGTTLDQLVEANAAIIYGILQPGPEVADGVLYVRPTEISDGRIVVDELRKTSPQIAERYRRASLKGGDIILSIVGTIGKVAVTPQILDGANITQSSCRIRPDVRFVSSSFLACFLRSPEAINQYDKFRLGTAVPRLNLEDVRKIVVPLPPVAEQRRIVAKLDSLTARTARARTELDHIPRLVEKYKQAILAKAFSGELTKEWRKQQPKLQHAHELVRGTAAPEQSRGGREATKTVKPGITAISVNDPGTTPAKGWAWVPLRRIARQETGHTPSRLKPDYWDGGVPWIGIKDAGAHHGQVIEETLQTISKLGLENSSARLLPAGTVCLSRTASVGYVTVMGKRMATSQDFATWTCSDALDPKYLMYALIAEGEHIKKFGEGSTHTTIYFPEIRAFNICLAPRLEQAEIVRRIEAAFAKVDTLEIEHARAIHLLPKLDQGILAKAFRGELVPQDPNDEPASVLLERINAERAQAGSSGTGRGRKRSAKES